MRVRFITFAGILVMLGVPYTALSSGKAQQRLAKLAWSVYTYSGRGESYSRPTCHKLGYFMGSPLRFDYGQDLVQYKPNRFTYKSNASLVDTVQGERVYQIEQDIHPTPRKASREVIVMKRLVVERHTNHFCMIFQEQGPMGPSGRIKRLRPATLEAGENGLVLRTDDPLNGTGGDHIGASWVFLRGVPVPLSLPNNLVEQLVRPILPANCGIRAGETTGTTGLTYHSNVWRKRDSSTTPTCGSVVLKLSVSNHKLALLSRNYIP
jgi:hypothetical protein